MNSRNGIEWLVAYKQEKIGSDASRCENRKEKELKILGVRFNNHGISATNLNEIERKKT